MKHLRRQALALWAACLLVMAPVLAQANVIFNRSGTIITANVAVTAMPAKASRTYLMCQNPIAASTPLLLRVDGTAVANDGAIELAAGGSVTWQSDFVPTGAVSVVSATAAARFICWEG